MIAVVAASALAGPATVRAAPPPNDTPAGAQAFQPVTAENGHPQDQQAIAELAEAHPDGGTPRCLGKASFQRTVWYRVPAQDVPQEVTVEGVGQTLDVVDMAAFVQPEGVTTPVVSQPNACAGLGSGGSDAAEEPTSGVTLRAPARRDILIQVGRHGPVKSADDERVLLTLETERLDPVVPPDGDIGDLGTALASLKRSNPVSLSGATITQEDPAEPACPSLGTLWRRFVPKHPGKLLVSVRGNSASTLTVFSGPRPGGDNALDCVNRAGSGELRMLVSERARRTLWIRIGADRPSPGTVAALTVRDGAGAVVVDGGPGGFDPTSGGPGGGLPAVCGSERIAGASITGPRISGKRKELNRHGALPVTLTVRRGPVCDVIATLVGPHRRVFALLRTRALLTGKRIVKLRRTRAFVKGAYRLNVTGVSELGGRVTVHSTVGGSIR